MPKKDPSLAICWFTFGPDMPVMLRSFASVDKQFHDAKKFVFIDAAPGVMPPHRCAMAYLTAKGAMVIPTSFPRRGNLLGWHAAKAISDAYVLMLRMTNADYVMKVDSDVLLLDASWHHKFFESGKHVGGVSSKYDVGVTGPNYILSAEAVGVLADSYAKDFMPYPYNTEEDFEMCRRTAFHYGKDVFHREDVALYGLNADHPNAIVGDYLPAQDNDDMREQMVKLWDEIIFPHPLTPPPEEIVKSREEHKPDDPRLNAMWRYRDSLYKAEIMRKLVKLKERQVLTEESQAATINE